MKVGERANDFCKWELMHRKKTDVVENLTVSYSLETYSITCDSSFKSLNF